MFKKLHKGYRKSINSRLRTFPNNFHTHHKKISNNNNKIPSNKIPSNKICAYYFVVYLSNRNKVFITAYSNNSYCINQIRSKCASKKGKLVDVKILLPKDVQNYSWELQDKLKSIPFDDIKGAGWKYRFNN